MNDVVFANQQCPTLRLGDPKGYCAIISREV